MRSRNVALIFVALISLAFVLSGCQSKSNKKIFGYSISQGPNQVNNFRILNDGTLDALAPSTFALGSIPTAIAQHPNGKFLYVISNSGDVIYLLAIAEDGSLSSLIGSPIAVSNPTDIAISNDEIHLYVTSDLGIIYQFEILQDGTLSPLTPASVSPGGNLTSIAITPNGLFAYVVNSGNLVNQYTINANGTLTPNTPATVAAAAGANDVVIPRNSGYVYVIGNSGINQYMVETSGKLTALTPALVSQSGGAFNGIMTLNGELLFVVNATAIPADQLVYSYRVGADGKLIAASYGPFAVGAFAFTMGLDATGRYLQVGNFVDGNLKQFQIKSNGNLIPFSGTVPNPSPYGFVSVFR